MTGNSPGDERHEWGRTGFLLGEQHDTRPGKDTHLHGGWARDPDYQTNLGYADGHVATVANEYERLGGPVNNWRLHMGGYYSYWYWNEP